MRFSAEVVMETAYLVCALVGGTLVACQFLLTVLGLGGHHDTGGGHDLAGHDLSGHDAGSHDSAHDHHDESGAASWFFSILTFRTVTAGVALFGLTGLFLGALDLGQPVTLGCAILAGLAALFTVSSLMRSMAQLNVDGTLHIRRAVGATGNVYLSIPANNAGLGKVHITVGGRLVEYKAVSRADDLPTGAPILVVGVVDADTVEVAPAPASERVYHE
jgi:hypothetical protein